MIYGDLFPWNKRSQYRTLAKNRPGSRSEEEGTGTRLTNPRAHMQ